MQRNRETGKERPEVGVKGRRRRVEERCERQIEKQMREKEKHKTGRWTMMGIE